MNNNIDAKTPIHDGHMGFESWECPNCKRTLCDDLPDKSIKFCKHCGQAIKWGEEYWHERDSNLPQ